VDFSIVPVIQRRENGKVERRIRQKEYKANKKGVSSCIPERSDKLIRKAKMRKIRMDGQFKKQNNNI